MKPSPLFSLKNIAENKYEPLVKTLQAIAPKGTCLALHGDLGSGKTSFARCFIRNHFNEPIMDVPSPTFNLMQHYSKTNIDTDIWHYDFYRLEDENEILELGFEDNIENAITIIEWPEKVLSHLPEDTLVLQFSQNPGHKNRDITFIGSNKWNNLEKVVCDNTEIAQLLELES